MEGKQHTVKPLTVYKASAGSGKTFTLAAEYIKLLIDNPHDYDKILAVTFTNKATEEMKSRILSQLYGISHHLPDSKDYADKICAELGIGEELLAQQAGKALRLLLHHYNFFRVQTIDTFFQGVMRNLAKELSLSNNLRISLNDKQVISEAVDSMMDSLSDNRQIMKWVEEYIDESMDDDKSWNVTEDIKSFGRNLTKEFFKSNRSRLDDMFNNADSFDEYKKKLCMLRSDIVSYYKEKGKEALDAIKAKGLAVEDFSNGKTGAMGYYLRLANGAFADKKIIGARIVDAVGNDKWYKAKSPNERAILDVANEHLKPIYREVEERRMDDVFTYNSIVKTLNNMNKLRLLHAIEEEILRQNGEHSRFMLSNTQTLLHSMIADDKGIASFIFEKIGTRIQHIMIDEFQDTSRVQWQNFKVLLEECMASPKYKPDNPHQVTNNLIVGDVKQSIYRFRSGDWRLLNDIDTDPQDGFNEQQLRMTSLRTNYRSERNIIDFNNIFFHFAANIEADRIEPKADADNTPAVAEKKREWAESLRKAYSDVCQDVPDDKDPVGEVVMRFIPRKVEDSNDQILNGITGRIDALVKAGAKLKDIAILVRKNKDIPKIANHFVAHAPHIPLVSEEAFRLDSSIAVRLLITAIKILTHPKDRISAAQFIKLYTQNISTKIESDCNPLLLQGEELASLLPQELSDPKMMEKLANLPLSELAERLIRILHLESLEGQTIYLSTFFDTLNKFVSDNSPVIEDFLKQWDEDLCSKTVSVGNIVGVRIMSMHKSKGLEFDHVIVPYCDWSMTPPGTETLWCETQSKPFSELPFIPVEYRNEESLNNSIYELYGSEESMQEIVDNLNLLYVAFTRAGKSLAVLSELSEGKVSYRSALIAETLAMIAEMKEPLTLANGKVLAPLTGVAFKESKEKEPLEFTFGTLTIRKEKSKNTSNVFLQPSEDVAISTKSYSNDAILFRQSNKSRDFADDTTDNADTKRYIHNGTILHQVFSSIGTIDDVDRALSELEFEGLLYNEDTTPEKLKAELMKKFNNPTVRNWFSDSWTIFNECTILHIDEEGHVVEDRPDRVITDGRQTIVIDYKFGKPKEEYKSQVARYIERLKSMNMPNVQGYLWYVNINKVELV